MLEIAMRSTRERSDLFRATAEQMKVHEAIIEKDFWVCWMLDYLFQESRWKDSLAFKGGTSLSKAYGIIERFSEDIDLILAWSVLGYSAEEPWEERSVTKQDAFGKESNQRTVEYLEREFVPEIAPALAERLGVEMEIQANGQNVLITYPKAFSLSAVQPQIRLEIGPMAAWIPNAPQSIRPYAAEKFPELFSKQETSVNTIAVERTFWEKATILHQEAHRGEEKGLPPRYSRHYYDMYRLSRSSVCRKALNRLDLLQDVAKFKMRFYRSPWAKYEEAEPGTLKLLPPQHNLAGLKRDYRSMQPMLFGNIPSFDEIIKEISQLETQINELCQV